MREREKKSIKKIEEKKGTRMELKINELAAFNEL
jgi:hypothetical protein